MVCAKSRLAVAIGLPLILVRPSPSAPEDRTHASAVRRSARGLARTLEQWEQGRRTPSGAAKTLIRVAVLHPEILREIAA